MIYHFGIWTNTFFYVWGQQTRQPLNTLLLSFLLGKPYKKEKAWFEYLVLMILLLQKWLDKRSFLQNFCLTIVEISYSGRKKTVIWGTNTTFVAVLSKRKHKSHHLQGSKPLVILLFEWAVEEGSLKAAAEPENNIQLQKALLQHWHKKKTTKSNTIC